MNQNNGSQEHNGRKDHNLTPEEKSAIKQNIVAFMASRPITSTEGETTTGFGEAIPSPWYSPARFYSMIYMRQITTAAFVAVILFGGTTISSAAERAIPGDVLYPFKTQINEKFSGYLALTEKSKARLESELATRRLSEAEELAVKGKLDAETSKTLETKFKKHVQAVNLNVDALEGTDNHDDAIRLKNSFNSNLNAHRNVLSELSSNDLGIEAWFEVVENASFDVEDKNIPSKKSEEKSEKKYAIVQRDIAEERFEKLQDLVQGSQDFKESDIIDSIEKVIEEATKEFEEKKYKAAADHFNQAAVEAQELYIELNARISLGMTITPIVIDPDLGTTTDEDSTSTEEINKSNKKNNSNDTDEPSQKDDSVIDSVTTDVKSKLDL